MSYVSASLNSERRAKAGGRSRVGVVEMWMWRGRKCTGEQRVDQSSE